MFRRTTFIHIASVLFVVALPDVSNAQSPIKASVNSSAYAKAISLYEQAVALYDEPRRAVDAARLHLEEVRYRTKRDPEAIESLAMAAHLFNYAKRPIEARRVMEQAAERALTIGDVGRAARAYVEAAFLAEKTKNKDQMQRLAVKAWLLAESPLLPEEQRTSIRRIIQASPTLAAFVN